MKKLLAVIAIAGVMTACNSNGTGSSSDGDTTIKTSDTTTVVKPNPDTMQVVKDSTIKVDVDTVNKH